MITAFVLWSPVPSEMVQIGASPQVDSPQIPQTNVNYHLLVLLTFCYRILAHDNGAVQRSKEDSQIHGQIS